MHCNPEQTAGPGVDKSAIGKAFGRAAATYDDYAALQRITGDRLREIAGMPAAGDLLDAGCGSGWYSRCFSAAGYRVTALDISTEMLRYARQQQSAADYLQADLDALPFRAGSFDVIWSNLALQWSNQLRQAVYQLRSALRPAGQLRFSTVAAGSLPEVDQAWQSVDGTAHTNSFLTVQQIAQAVCGYGIRLIHEPVTLHFPSARAALWSLKGVGAGHLHQRTKSLPLTRQRLALLDAGWPKETEGYRLSYQIVYGVTE